ncbi:MAG: Fpg/Nei family DNA glycosylase [Sandaracinaceae bacterium]|nr:Fpg/Nei family DNA glycosylase [Sandaracinaceae bacterium]
MPEGDTIRRTADVLRRAIGGARVRAFSSARPELAGAALAGATVEAIEPRGKHLLVRFDDGRALHTHLGMHGSWHVYRPGERWRLPAHRAHAVIETDTWIAVCFDPPTCALVRAGRTPTGVARLGPDLSDAAPDLDEAVRRLRAEPTLALGVAVMRQDLVSGIGNVYKSEVLFVRRLDPFAPIASADDAALRALLEEARRLLRRNVGRPRRTAPRRLGAPHWVYGRAGEPCFACGAPIARAAQGQPPRSTYFCPACQRAAAPS